MKEPHKCGNPLKRGAIFEHNDAWWVEAQLWISNRETIAGYSPAAYKHLPREHRKIVSGHMKRLRQDLDGGFDPNLIAGPFATSAEATAVLCTLRALPTGQQQFDYMIEIDKDTAEVIAKNRRSLLAYRPGGPLPRLIGNSQKRLDVAKARAHQRFQNEMRALDETGILLQ